MAFAEKINTLIFDEGTGTWVAGPQIVVTKNSFAVAEPPEDDNSKTQIRCNDGSNYRVNQDLDTILAFLNS